MYEDKTYESIRDDALSAIETDVLKTEGSLVYNAVSALAFELEKLYLQLDYVLRQMSPETADFESLKAMAAQRAVYPAEATRAQVRVAANAVLPVGARFSLQSFTYAITGQLDDGSYLAVCEQAGSQANNLTGQLTAITYVQSLTYAAITEVLVGGSDEDGRDQLYRKYFESFTTQSYAGNISAYKEKMLAHEGIGGCKVYPVWAGVGTVKLVLQSSTYGAVSQYLINQIQEEVCPEPSEGYGFAPINHDVTVESVKVVTVNVATKITYRQGYSWASCADNIRAAVRSYLMDIAQDWGKDDYKENGTVYVSRMESAILNVDGVLDVQNTKLNNSTNNIVLASDAIPTMGEVTSV